MSRPTQLYVLSLPPLRRWSPTPTQDAIYNLYLLQKETQVLLFGLVWFFSMKCHQVYNHILRHVPCQGVAGQHKMLSRILFACLFVSFWSFIFILVFFGGWGGYFFLIELFLFLFYFFFSFSLPFFFISLCSLSVLATPFEDSLTVKTVHSIFKKMLGKVIIYLFASIWQKLIFLY